MLCRLGRYYTFQMMLLLRQHTEDLGALLGVMALFNSAIHMVRFAECTNF